MEGRYRYDGAVALVDDVDLFNNNHNITVINQSFWNQEERIFIDLAFGDDHKETH